VTPHVILVPDGMADEPLPELGGRTPLGAARTPNMDALAAAGTTGLVRTVPPGMPAGSDVANLAVLGYDARALFTGRAPLEAASMGVRLAPGDVAYRCNLVAIVGGLMNDNTAGGIGSDEARPLVAALAERFSGEPFEFHAGVGYRHLMVWRGGAEAVCTPPHDILDCPAADYLPVDAGGAAAPGGPATRLREVMTVAHDVLAELRPGTDIWLWGEGRAPRIPPLLELRGVHGAVIAAVDLVRGIGVLAGMDVLDVPGATGDLETDYAAKGRAALTALADHELVFVHVEAPDEAGHRGDAAAKVEAIERVDAAVLGPLLAPPRRPALLVVPDHFTPVRLRTHTDPPVPFAFAGGGTEALAGRAVSPAQGGFSEHSAAATGLFIGSGPELMDRFLAAGG
jgi:2,3-bisphosphoglycerate-independent phosphoglycerate mutase